MQNRLPVIAAGIALAAAIVAAAYGIAEHARGPQSPLHGIPPITNPEVSRKQQYNLRVAYLTSRAPLLRTAFFGSGIRTAAFTGFYPSSGFVTADGSMYVTALETSPQGSMREFYGLYVLWSGRLQAVHMPPPSAREANAEGFLDLGIDTRSTPNAVLVDAHDYDGRTYVLEVRGYVAYPVPELRPGNQLFTNTLADGRACAQPEDAQHAVYALWTKDRAGRLEPFVSQAELTRVTGGILDQTLDTGVSLTCSYFNGQNFINIKSAGGGFFMRVADSHLTLVAAGELAVSGARHALAVQTNPDPHPTWPTQDLELLAVR